MLDEALSTVDGRLREEVAALARAHDDLRDLFASTRLPILSLDASLRVERWTPAASRLLDLRDRDLGRPLDRLGARSLLDGLAEQARDVLETGTATDRQVESSGRSFAREVLPHRARGDRPEGVVVILTDATELQRAVRSAAHLAAIVESSEDAILSHDLEGLVQSWNGAAERLYGYSAEEIVGRSIHRIVPDERMPQLREAMATLRRGGSLPPFRTTRVDRDGRRVDVSVNLSPLRDATGAIVGVSAIDRDVTAQLRARAQLEESERRFRAIFDNAAVGIAQVGLDGRFLLVNPQFAEITGYTIDELEEKTFQDITHPEDVEADLWELEALAAGRRSRYEMEKRYLRRDGTTAWVHLTVAAVRSDSDGAPSYYVSLATDITERKRLELALRQSETRHRIAAWAAQVGTFEWRIPTNENYWTPELEALYGLPAGGFGGSYRAWTEGVHPDDLAAAEAAVVEALETGTLEAEWRARWPDGTVRWLEARGWVEKGEDGHAIRMIGVNFDITERKETERVLHRVEELRRLALASAQMGTWDLDLATGRLHWDERAQELFGIDGAEVALEAPLARIHPSDRERVDRMIRTATDPDGSDGSYDLEYRVAPEEGVERWVRAMGQVQFESRHGERRPTRFLGVLMDTTAQREAAAAKREQEDRYRLAVEAGALGTWTYDPSRKTSRWDARAKAIFGLPVDAPIALERAISVIHPDDRPRALEALTRALEARGRYAITKRITPPNGPMRWVRTNGLVTTGGPDERDVRLIGVVQDITEQKRNEEALLEANRRKDDYLAMLGHELRNPLASIRNAGEILRMEAERVPALARPTSVLQRQTQHMGTLLDGLLDVSRITRGKLRTEMAPIDLRAVVREVVSDRAPEARARDVALRANAEDPLPVRGDRARLRQVLDNLVGNALAFTDAGGSIEVTATAEADDARICVRDTGRGFDPELAPHLFEPFQQGPQEDLSRSSGGLGLGLALARGLTELHGGTLEGWSEGLGRGATFEVRVPRTAGVAPPPSAPDPAAEASPETPRLSILLTEDDEDGGELFTILLEKLGHEVRWVRTGREALEVAPVHRPDVIVSDIGLPDISGYEVARGLRADPAVRGALFVAVSGYGRAEDKRAAAAAGFEVHLTKPVKLGDLRRALSRAKSGAPKTGSNRTP